MIRIDSNGVTSIPVAVSVAVPVPVLLFTVQLTGVSKQLTPFVIKSRKPLLSEIRNNPLFR